MRLLLIYPEFPDTFWSFKHALQFIRKRASLPPLGLLTVAAMLPPGWEQRLVDLNVCKLTEQDLQWEERRQWVFHIMVSDRYSDWRESKMLAGEQPEQTDETPEIKEVSNQEQ